MDWWLLIPIVPAAALVAFLAVIFIRAAAFKPKAQTKIEDTLSSAVEFDRNAAVEALATLVRCKTVSYKRNRLRHHRLCCDRQLSGFSLMCGRFQHPYEQLL